MCSTRLIYTGKDRSPNYGIFAQYWVIDILPAVERTGILDGSSQLATEVVLLSLPVRLKSPHALQGDYNQII
ncbi:hypothetical protein QUB60_03480 [Microcoleus sp. A2-C5]|uniref:hypothetical protein n=1 Tax=Microcoleaceae TaxID=1892252 RepID=UPI0022375F46|nr:hypothetical protein [Lyngbya sp. CCAP 1446/10]MCW6053176.1 hypothetical protein [Lyngbya sp. CCAP 1446/10]